MNNAGDSHEKFGPDDPEFWKWKAQPGSNLPASFTGPWSVLRNALDILNLNPDEESRRIAFSLINKAKPTCTEQYAYDQKELNEHHPQPHPMVTMEYDALVHKYNDLVTRRSMTVELAEHFLRRAMVLIRGREQ